MAIRFHQPHPKFTLEKKTVHKKWIRACVEQFSKKPGSISFIFTTNDELLKMNREFLNHNYFTDVITFDYCEGDEVSGDIFISADQVAINATEYGVSEDEEMRRVMIHGVLHLLGFDDATEQERSQMRKMENDALLLWLKVIGNESAI
jgi:rRNA maturation RNase YbeY